MVFTSLVSVLLAIPLQYQQAYEEHCSVTAELFKLNQQCSYKSDISANLYHESGGMKLFMSNSEVMVPGKKRYFKAESDSNGLNADLGH